MEVSDSQGTIDWYDTNARQYGENIEPYPSRDLTNRFIELLGNRHDILDAGCAAGRDSSYFQQQGLGVTGVDLSEGLIKVAKEKHPEIKFVQGDFRQLPFEESSFDGVWAHASLVHMQELGDTQKSLNEFKRVLRDDGILHVFVKTGDSETDVVNDKLSGHNRFFRYYTKEQMEELVENSGFEIIDSGPHSDPAGREDVEWIAIFAKKKTG